MGQLGIGLLLDLLEQHRGVELHGAALAVVQDRLEQRHGLAVVLLLHRPAGHLVVADHPLRVGDGGQGALEVVMELGGVLEALDGAQDLPVRPGQDDRREGADVEQLHQLGVLAGVYLEGHEALVHQPGDGRFGEGFLFEPPAPEAVVGDELDDQRQAAAFGLLARGVVVAAPADVSGLGLDQRRPQEARKGGEKQSRGGSHGRVLVQARGCAFW